MNDFTSDFQLWAASCVQIRDKQSGRFVPFRLNAPQKRLLAIMERQRIAGDPIRVILLKSRQWGGSTLIQMYMAWIQCIHRKNWHSLICAHQKDTASTIRGMYSLMLDRYPRELWNEEEPPAFKPFERSQNIRVIAGRDCRVTIGSSENQEASRGADIAMAHLSEVAFWRDTRQHSPEDFIRSVCSGIPMEPLTVIALESTANGVGNYFHTAWLRAKAGDSAYIPMFVPWHEIGIYSRPVPDPEGFRSSLDRYELALLDRGLSLEQVKWYHDKRREMASDRSMKSEYPTDDIEAFVSSSSEVFDHELLEAMRSHCAEPRFTGELSAELRPIADSRGCLEIWRHPHELQPGSLTLAAVDVGGRSERADWSVITVMVREPDAKPEVAAQWRGHIDHDLLARKAVQIGRYYGNALLVVESNTLEQQGAEENSAMTILEHLSRSYPRIYRRRSLDRVTGQLDLRLGFHTNRATKAAAVNTLIAAIREGGYLERDHKAIDEMRLYELQPNGTYAARAGHHDDRVMTRAIALYVMETMPVPDLTYSRWHKTRD